MEYVLITGASTGIGFELAKIFAQNNYALILVSSSNEKILNAKKQIEKESDVPILTYALGSANILYEEIKQLGIPISILINNAGFGLIGETEKIDFNKDEKMIILNDITLVNLTKLFLPDMCSRKKGKILNVSSTGAFQPGPYTSTCFASKSFVLSYTRAVQYEAKKKGVNVSVLCPGQQKRISLFKRGLKNHSMQWQRIKLRCILIEK